MSLLKTAGLMLTFITLASPLYAQDATPHANMHGQHSMKNSPNANKAEYDLQFLDTMSAHHQSAMDMAKLVDQRGS